MILLAIDPGYVNCGWVLLVNGVPKKWGGWLGDKSFSSQTVDLRCCQIARGLQGLIVAYDVDVVATEMFFAKPKMASKTNYDRGRFDLWFDMAAGHLHRYYVNPTHLKTWVTGKGKAKKPEMIEPLRQRLLERYPDFLTDVYATLRPELREHVLEAYAIGWLAATCERLRMGVTLSLNPAHRELCAREFNKGNPRPPLFKQIVDLPLVTDLG